MADYKELVRRLRQIGDTLPFGEESLLCTAANAIDALQRRCDDLEKSRQAWVRKCEALTGQLQETMEERERMKELAEDYLKSFYEENHLRNDLLVHPWKNLWRHIKEALGIG